MKKKFLRLFFHRSTVPTINPKKGYFYSTTFLKPHQARPQTGQTNTRLSTATTYTSNDRSRYDNTNPFKSLRNQSQQGFRMSTEKSVTENTKLMKSTEKFIKSTFETLPNEISSQQIITEKSFNLGSTGSKSAGLRTRPFTATNLRPVVSRFSQDSGGNTLLR